MKNTQLPPLFSSPASQQQLSQKSNSVSSLKGFRGRKARSIANSASVGMNSETTFIKNTYEEEKAIAENKAANERQKTLRKEKKAEEDPNDPLSDKALNEEVEAAFK